MLLRDHAGILELRRYRERPERQEYVLTPPGRELLPVVMAPMPWGDAHLGPGGAPASVLHAGCGGAIGAHAAFERCDLADSCDEVEWRHGPGSGRPPGPRPGTAHRDAASEAHVR